MVEDSITSTTSPTFYNPTYFPPKLPPSSQIYFKNSMPKRKATRKRSRRSRKPNSRKPTFRRRRNPLYRGRRVQGVTKPLLLTSRFRKVYWSLSVPQFSLTPSGTSGGLGLPIRFPIGNMYDPLGKGITDDPQHFTIIDLPIMAPGYVYGPARGHDVLAKLFMQYRVIGMNAQAKFMQEQQTATGENIGMKFIQWSDIGLAQHPPTNYYDFLERFGPIPVRRTGLNSKPIYSHKYGKQGKCSDLAVNSEAPDYTHIFHEVRQATHQGDDLYLYFYAPELHRVAGHLEIQLTYYVQCLNPSSQDDLPTQILEI